MKAEVYALQSHESPPQGQAGASTGSWLKPWSSARAYLCLLAMPLTLSPVALVRSRILRGQGMRVEVAGELRPSPLQLLRPGRRSHPRRSIGLLAKRGHAACKGRAARCARKTAGTCSTLACAALASVGSSSSQPRPQATDQHQPVLLQRPTGCAVSDVLLHDAGARQVRVRKRGGQVVLEQERGAEVQVPQREADTWLQLQQLQLPRQVHNHRACVGEEVRVSSASVTLGSASPCFGGRCTGASLPIWYCKGVLLVGLPRGRGLHACTSQSYTRMRLPHSMEGYLFLRGSREWARSPGPGAATGAAGSCACVQACKHARAPAPSPLWPSSTKSTPSLITPAGGGVKRQQPGSSVCTAVEGSSASSSHSESAQASMTGP